MNNLLLLAVVLDLLCHNMPLITDFGASFIDVEPKVDQLIEDVTFLVDVEGGKWELIGNQFIFYKADNVTEVARFNTFNEAGLPAMENIMKCERI